MAAVWTETCPNYQAESANDLKVDSIRMIDKIACSTHQCYNASQGFFHKRCKAGCANSTVQAAPATDEA